MPVFAAPAFLLAGALAALVPLALHLIRRRPPLRAPFPTARFLLEDPRNAVHAGRPTDLPLLVMRMALLLLLGVGLARPAWLPDPSGTVFVVLLDRSAPAGGWPAAVGEARSSLLASDGTARGALVLFDTLAETVGEGRLSAAYFDSLAAAGPEDAPADYAAGLRAVPSAVRGVRGADSVRVRLVSPLDGAWTDGLGEVRRAAWRGEIGLAPVARRAIAGSAAALPARRALVVAGEGGAYAAAALGALGYEVARTADGAPAGPALIDRGADLYLVLDPAPSGDGLWAELASTGATVVVRANGVAADSGGELWFGAGHRLTGAGPAVEGIPSADRRVVAARADGRPAATARRVGTGCVVEVAVHLEGGELPFQAAYPAALGRLARGCEEEARTPGLDAGALALLRGAGPAALPADGGARGGTALGRWFLLAALAVALAETFVAYRRRTR